MTCCLLAHRSKKRWYRLLEPAPNSLGTEHHVIGTLDAQPVNRSCAKFDEILGAGLRIVAMQALLVRFLRLACGPLPLWPRRVGGGNQSGVVEEHDVNRNDVVAHDEVSVGRPCV